MEEPGIVLLLKAVLAIVEIGFAVLVFIVASDGEPSKRLLVVIPIGGVLIPFTIIHTSGVWLSFFYVPIYALAAGYFYHYFLTYRLGPLDAWLTWKDAPLNWALINREARLKQKRIAEGDANFYRVTLKGLAATYNKVVLQPDDFMRLFETRLEAILAKHQRTIPQTFRDAINGAVRTVYEYSQPDFPNDKPESFSDFRIRAERAKQAIERFDPLLIAEACVSSMWAFVKPLKFGEGFLTLPAKQILPVGEVVRDMIMPFYKTGDIEARGLCAHVREKYRAGTGIAKGKLHTTRQVWPEDYTGPDLISVYLLPEFQMLFELAVPYNPFTDQNRVAHHWCLGRNQTGKTTYLRHLLNHDLQRAAKGECSLVVIDSKSMVSHMRDLAIFGPGQPLDGCLTIIDSERRFPLNPFYIENKLQARGLIEYMIGNLDPAPGQERALPFLIDAALQSRDKSLHTLLRYVKMDADTLPSEIGSFSPDVQNWFKTTRKGLHSMTQSGLEQRLAAFLLKYSHTPFFKNLNASRWGDQSGKFDLFDELHAGGRVLLVDTDDQRNEAEGVNLMGRLFIAMLHQTMQRRMKLENKKPIFIYIDEASDYLSHDRSFIQILTKAGEARMGLTVAYQYKGQQGVDKSVENALDNASIHSETIEPGSVDVTINQRTKLTLPIKRFEFKEQDKMSGEDYKGMRERLAFLYPYAETKRREVDDEPLLQKKT